MIGVARQKAVAWTEAMRRRRLKERMSVRRFCAKAWELDDILLMSS